MANLYVNSAYNSTTEGWGTTHFGSFESAQAYVVNNPETINPTDVSIFVEKTSTVSGNCLTLVTTYNPKGNQNREVAGMSVTVKDGAIVGDAASKLDLTYTLTLEAGAVWQSARGVGSGYGNVHVKNKLIIGEAGAEKQAKIKFINGPDVSYKTMSIALLSGLNRSITANNALIEVGDFGLQSNASFTDTTLTIEGILAIKGTARYKTTMTDTDVTIKGHNLMNEPSYYSTVGTILATLTMDNTTITVDDGNDATAAETVWLGYTGNTAQKLTMTNGSVITVEKDTLVKVANVVSVTDSTITVGHLDASATKYSGSGSFYFNGLEKGTVYYAVIYDNEGNELETIVRTSLNASTFYPKFATLPAGDYRAVCYKDEAKTEIVQEKTYSFGPVGSITLTNSTLNAEKLSISAGNITMDVNSTISFKEIEGGYITISTDGYAGGTYKLLDYTGTGAKDKAYYQTVLGSSWANNYFVKDSDLYLTDQSNAVLYVNSAWNAENAGDKIFGYNAFASLDSAIKAAIDNGGGDIVLTDTAVSSDNLQKVVTKMHGASGMNFSITGNSAGNEFIAIEMRDDSNINPAEDFTELATLKIFDANLNCYKLAAYQNSKLTVENSYIDFHGDQNGPVYTKGNGEIYVKDSTIDNNVQISAMGAMMEFDNSTLNSGSAAQISGAMVFKNNSVYTLSSAKVYGNTGSLTIDNSTMVRKAFRTGADKANTLVYFINGAANISTALPEYTYCIFVGGSQYSTTAHTGTGTMSVVNGSTFDFSSAYADANYSNVAGYENSKGLVGIGVGSTLNIAGSTFKVDRLINEGTITIDAASTLTAATLDNSGTITIDAAAFTDGVKKVVDLSGTTSLEGKVTVNNLAEGVKVLYGADGDVILAGGVDTKTVYFDESYTDNGTQIGDKVVGVNAFNKIDYSGTNDKGWSNLMVLPADTDTVVLSAGNTVSYGMLRPTQVLQVKTAGDGYAVVDRVVNMGVDLTIAEDAKIKVLCVGGLSGANNQGGSLIVNGELYFANANSSNKAIYLWGSSTTPGQFVINAGGKLIADAGNVENHGVISVYGYMELGSAGDAPKLAGVGNYNGHLLVDGKDGEGKLVVNHNRVNFGGGNTSNPWQDAAEGCTVTVQNGGVISSKAVYFRNGKNNTLTLNNGTLEFVATDYSWESVAANLRYFDNQGAIVMSNGAKLSMAGRTFTNAGTITLDYASTITAGWIDNANGSITIDADGFSDRFVKVIDVAGNGLLAGTLTVNNLAEGVKVIYGADGDVALTNQNTATLYVNSAWAGKTFGDDADGKVYGYNAFSSLAEIANTTLADGADSVVKFESDVDAGSVEFNYGAGDITFTADKAVTIKQNANGTDWAFVVGGVQPVITIGKNVTFQIRDNSSGIYVYYGAGLKVEGTITGGENWGCIYLAMGNHSVEATGTVSTGRVHLAWTTLTVNGDADSDRTAAHIDTNYLLVEDSTFNANNAIIDAAAIHDTNNGGMRYGASTFNFNNSKLTAGSLTIKYADSVVNFKDSDAEISGAVTNAGTINIAGSEFAGSVSGTGVINVYGESAVSGVVAQKIVFGSAEKSVDADVDVTGWTQADFTAQNGTVDITGQMADGAFGLAPMLIGGFYNNNNEDVRGEAAMGSTVVNVTADAKVSAQQVYIADNEAVNEHTLNVYGELASTSIYNKAMGNLNICGNVSANYLQGAGDVTVSGANAVLTLAGVGGNGAAKIGTDVEGLRSQFTIADGATVTAGGAFAVGYSNGSRQGDLVLTSGKLDVASLSIDAGSTFSVNAVNGLVLVGGELSGTGTITIDAAEFTGSKLLVDMDSCTFAGEINLINASEGLSIIRGEDGDIVLTDVTLETVYVNTAWDGKAYGDIVDGKVIGVNAFSALEDISEELTQGRLRVYYTSDKASTVTLVGEAYTTYQIDGRNSYVLATQQKDVEIEAGETIFDFTNASGNFKFTAIDPYAPGNAEDIFINFEWDENTEDGYKVGDDMFYNKNAFNKFEEVGADITKDKRTFHYIANAEGTLQLTIKADTYTTYAINGRNSYVFAGATKTVEIAVARGKACEIEFTNSNGIYTLDGEFIPPEELVSDAVSNLDDTYDNAREFDLANGDIRRNWVGAEDNIDWFAVSNFEAKRTTFTLDVVDGEGRVAATVYTLIDGELSKVRTWSTRTSSSIALDMSADNQYFIKVTGTENSTYTMQLA